MNKNKNSEQNSISNFIKCLCLSLAFSPIYLCAQNEYIQSEFSAYLDGVYITNNKKTCSFCEQKVIQYFKELRSNKTFPLFFISLVDYGFRYRDIAIAEHNFSFCDSIIYFDCTVKNVYYYQIIDYDSTDIFQQISMQESPKVIVKQDESLSVYNSKEMIKNGKISSAFIKRINRHIRKGFK